MLPLSLITINYNNREGLAKTLASVAAQKNVRFEYIVIDGGSGDGSADLLQTFEHIISKKVSERDSGIYNAMNKGLRMASGEYVLFLNSGDFFTGENALAELMNAVNGEDVLYADIVLRTGKKETRLRSAAEIYFPNAYQHNLPPHPAFLAKRSLLADLGGFDESYKIIADVVLIAEVFAKKPKYKYVPMPLTVFDLNGVSSQKSNRLAVFTERKRFIEERFPDFLPQLLKQYKPAFFQKIVTYVRSKI